MVKRRQRAASTGFTLVEILVTILLVTVALVGLAALQIASIRQVTFCKRSDEATRLGQSMLEQSMALPLTQLQAAYTEQGTPPPSWPVPTPTNPESWSPLVMKDGASLMTHVGADGESYGPFTVQRYIDVAGAGFLITIRVSWIESPGRANVQLSTRREI